MPNRNHPQERAPDRHGFKQEGKDLLRAVSAGSLVGFPLLLTMEMWWWGMVFEERRLLTVLGLTLLANFLFSFFVGFRREFSWSEAALESVTSVGMALVIAAGILWLIGEIDGESNLSEALGKILIEAIPVSIGVSFANSRLQGEARGDEEESAENGDEEDESPPSGPEQWQGLTPARRQLRQDFRDAGVSAGGALLFSFNAAPTEEILMIASRLPGWRLALIVPVSFVLCYVILFASGFMEHKPHHPSFFQTPLVETVIAYALALAIAFALLYGVGMPEVRSQFSTFISCGVVLGLLGSVGAAAGRLAG